MVGPGISRSFKRASCTRQFARGTFLICPYAICRKWIKATKYNVFIMLLQWNGRAQWHCSVWHAVWSDNLNSNVFRSVKKLTRSIQGQQKASITASWCSQASSHAWSLPNCCFIKAVIPTGCDRSIKQDRFFRAQLVLLSFPGLFLPYFCIRSSASLPHKWQMCVERLFRRDSFHAHIFLTWPAQQQTGVHRLGLFHPHTHTHIHKHTLKCRVCICLSVGEVRGPQGTNSRRALWGQGGLSAY